MKKYECPKKSCGASRFKTVNKKAGIYECRKCGTVVTPQKPAKIVEV
jgi:ribosomal protein L37AE/L43A